MPVSPDRQVLSARRRRQQQDDWQQLQVAPLTSADGPEMIGSKAANSQRLLHEQLASPGNCLSSQVLSSVSLVEAERRQHLRRNPLVSGKREQAQLEAHILPLLSLAFLGLGLAVISSVSEAKSIINISEPANFTDNINLDTLIALERLRANSSSNKRIEEDRLESGEKFSSNNTISSSPIISDIEHLPTSVNDINEKKKKANLAAEDNSKANAETDHKEEHLEETGNEDHLDEATLDENDDLEDVQCTSSLCKDISADEPAKTKNLTDNERLVDLQSRIRAKVRQGILGSTRTGLELFEKLSLSGGCTASLIKLTSSLGDLKSFAFKFLDASAKVPSGMMYGLLSDYGDFDECLSIRSNPLVEPEMEAEEGAYSGKYCLMSVKMNYHVTVEPNSSVPEGIQEDGILWDDLIRNYWTSNSLKGFHVGICLPSRCTTDDIDQLFKAAASNYNFLAEVVGCQDSLDLKNQLTPDQLQRHIINAFYILICLTITGTIIERYLYNSSLLDGNGRPVGQPVGGDLDLSKATLAVRLVCEILVCFSISRNWNKFMGKNRNWLISERSNQSNCYPRFGYTINTNLTTSTASITRPSPMSASVLDQSYSYSQQELVNEVGNRLNIGVEQSNESKLGQLTAKIEPDNYQALKQSESSRTVTEANELVTNELAFCQPANTLSSLSGLRLFVIIWITIGHSFLYPSANNYQYYRSIINMNITRDSVWFATTNFTLGIDMLLYMIGLVFVYKLARNDSATKTSQSNCHLNQSSPATNNHQMRNESSSCSSIGCSAVIKLLTRKVLRLWPTYLTLIALAIVVPLVSDGPMWPELVSRRIGNSCRENWWSNLLFVNNFFLSESQICLPSSWFVSIMMQLFLIGSLLIIIMRKYSPRLTVLAITLLLLISCAYSFAVAYLGQLRAPMIRMDESFVMEMDENLFRLYTNFFNNLGPFLIGMVGGFVLLRAQSGEKPSRTSISPRVTPYRKTNSSKLAQSIKRTLEQVLIGFIVLIIAVLVLSSVFHQHYSVFWASIYWSLHRIGWAIVTGYVIHMCATRKWKLLNDMLSLSTFIPLSKLIFIAYLVYPIFIHLHSGFVRDGLHVSIYNMMNIYTTRLVMTFTTALLIHLLVELPFHSLEEICQDHLFKRSKTRDDDIDRLKSNRQSEKVHPLLTVAPDVTLYIDKQAETPIDGTPPNVIERVKDIR